MTCQIASLVGRIVSFVGNGLLLFGFVFVLAHKSSLFYESKNTNGEDNIHMYGIQRRCLGHFSIFYNKIVQSFPWCFRFSFVQSFSQWQECINTRHSTAGAVLLLFFHIKQMGQWG